MIGMVRVITVSTVHKKVQQWAQEQQHIRKNAKQVRGVFGNQEESSDSQEGDKDHPCRRP